jgi:anti-sigma-K factor RskA
MSEERRINEIEDMLREAGRPEAPPVHFRDLARREALGQGEVVEMRAPLRPRGAGGRLLLAAAVLVASAAAALVIGVGGNRMQVYRSVHLAGSGSASAVVDIGNSHNGVRQLVLHVDGLRPAPAGGYYELWMQKGNSDPTALAAFDTGSSGHVVANASMPASLGWTRCWVTLERSDGSSSTVLQFS